MLVDGEVKGAGVYKLAFRFCSISTISVSGLGFRVRCRLFLTAKSRSMNYVDAPLSIIAEPVVFLLRRTGTIIGSLHPKSAELIPVDSKPLHASSVSGNSLS